MLWYVSTPYSKYPGGIDAAWTDACKAAAALIKQGIAVYSPIVHTHPVAVHGHIDPYNHAIWIPLDRHMMRACDGLIVVCMPTWETSKGVDIEITEFRSAGKRIRWFKWPSMEEVDHHLRVIG
jgi:hypothetical protein